MLKELLPVWAITAPTISDQQEITAESFLMVDSPLWLKKNQKPESSGT